MLLFFRRLQGISKSVEYDVWWSKWSAVFSWFSPREFFQLQTSKFSSPFNFSQETNKKTTTKQIRTRFLTSIYSFSNNFFIFILYYLLLFSFNLIWENEGRNIFTFNQNLRSILILLLCVCLYVCTLEVSRLWTRSFANAYVFFFKICSAWSNIFLIFFVFVFVLHICIQNKQKRFFCLSFSHPHFIF